MRRSGADKYPFIITVIIIINIRPSYGSDGVRYKAVVSVPAVLHARRLTDYDLNDETS